MTDVVLAATLATALSTWQLVPQVARSRRTGSTAGLSIAWAAIGLGLNIGWLGYRWSRGLWLSMLSPAITAFLFLSLLRQIPNTVPHRTDLRAYMSVGLSLLVAAAFGGWPLVGLALSAWSSVQILPAVSSAYRTHGGLAIAPGLWVVGLGQSASWGYYGIAVGDPALVLYGIVMGLGSALILVRLIAHRSRPRPIRGALRPTPMPPLPAGAWAWVLVYRQSA